MRKPEDMMPIGTIRAVKSVNYGDYNTVCIARLDLMKLYAEKDKGGKWLEKYHPTRYFISCGWDAEDEKESVQRYISFVIPLIHFNQDWNKNNPNCEYFNKVLTSTRIQELPIGIPTKQYEQWLKHSSKLLDAFLDPEQF